MRLAITAFIAGGSLLLFLSTVPEHWLILCSLLITIATLSFWFTRKIVGLPYLSQSCTFVLFFIIGFAWNAHYAEGRLQNILSEELEGQDLTIEGRVNALPQGNPSGAKFSFAVDRALIQQELISHFPQQIYLSWQPAWCKSQSIPDIIPGQRW